MIIEYFIGGASDKNDAFSTIIGSTRIMERLRDTRAGLKKNIVTLYNGHEEKEHIFRELMGLAKNNSDCTFNRVVSDAKQL
jgi:hypothetical protein